MDYVKIIQILPELILGGVERHVIDLSNELVKQGHEVLVVSAGGQMERQLNSQVQVYHLPVQKKNLFSGLYCVMRLARLIKSGGWQIMHAHSRVPAWIANWTSEIVNIPWIYTAHALYSLNFGLYPLKKAKLVICISKAVQQHLQKFLPHESVVLYNGLSEIKHRWHNADSPIPTFLCVGRLTRLKGIDALIETFAMLLKNGYSNWRLILVGDGPLRQELENKCQMLQMQELVHFAGYQENVVAELLNCSCYLLPSLSEGMGLTLIQGAKMGVPIFASNIPAVREIALTPEKLIEPGSVSAWYKTLSQFLDGDRDGFCQFDTDKLLLESEMAEKVTSLYRHVMQQVM